MPLLQQFCLAAEAAGAKVVSCDNLAHAVTYLVQEAGETLLLPVSASCLRHQLAEQLQAAGVKLPEVKREAAAQATAGVTSACFGIADTGTLVLDSLAEDVRKMCAWPAPCPHDTLSCWINAKLLPMAWLLSGLCGRFINRIPVITWRILPAPAAPPISNAS